MLATGRSFGGHLIAMSTFEHVKRFWRGFEEVQRILRPTASCS